MERFLEGRWSLILIGCVGTPPARLLAYLLPGCPWLYEQPINDKPMWIDDCRTIMRGCVDPREKSVIVPGLSGFLKRAQDFISFHGGAALMSEPPANQRYANMVGVPRRAEWCGHGRSSLFFPHFWSCRDSGDS